MKTHTRTRIGIVAALLFAALAAYALITAAYHLSAYGDPAGSGSAAPHGAATVELAPAFDAAPAPVVVHEDGTVATPMTDKIASDPVGFVQEMVAAARGGGWRYLSGGLLMLVMVVFLKVGGKLRPSSRRGKSIMVMILAAIGAIATGLLSPIPLDYKLFTGAIGIAWTAVGARRWIADILWPDDGGKQWLTWLKPLFGKS